jgi:hypothetical protein
VQKSLGTKFSPSPFAEIIVLGGNVARKPEAENTKYYASI